MRRTGAVLWHASFSVFAAVLYFFFVLPRWFELTGELSPTLGTVLRIVTGVLIGSAALPVVFTFLRTRRPEFGTPQLALQLRVASIVLHVVAGVLIVGLAVTEIWVSLDTAGQWLFGGYGAAAALALLGILAFYLAFVAELPPPPPKPLKAKKRSTRRGRKDDTAVAADADTEESEEAEEAEAAVETEAAEETQAADETEDTTEAETHTDTDTKADTDTDEDTGGKLRNRRPSGKARQRRRLRGGVVVDD